MKYFKFLILFLCAVMLGTPVFAADAGNEEAPQYRLGFVRSPHDAVQKLGADLVKVDEAWLAAHLPAQVSLAGSFAGFEMYNQGQLGSCTANAASNALAGTHHKLGLDPMALSRLALYYWSREEMAKRSDPMATQRDTGASLYDVTTVLRERGYCDEGLWPYSDGPDKFKVAPETAVEEAARKHKVLDGMGVAYVGDDIRAAQGALANGFPVIFGLSLTPSFMKTGPDGIVAEPGLYERPMGGHAMTLVGYDNERQSFRLRNSWGTHWGDKGEAWITYTHWKHYTSEAWAYHSVTGAPEAAEELRGMSLQPAPEGFAI